MRRANRKRELALTQKLLGEMLGFNRASVTLFAQRLQQRGAIRYSRGRITILDRAALEASACECYHTIRELYRRFLSSRDCFLQTKGLAREQKQAVIRRRTFLITLEGLLIRCCKSRPNPVTARHGCRSAEYISGCWLEIEKQAAYLTEVDIGAR